MPPRLARLLAVLTIQAVLLAATVATASAAGIGRSSAVSPATARQALAITACPNAPLGAPEADQVGAMLCLVNETRARRGLPALAESPLLRQSAAEKSGDLIGCNEFSHTACGREFAHWIRESGYMSPECWRVGENLAWGVAKQATVGSIFNAWMHSPLHRANILGDFEEIGIDLRVGKMGGLTGVHVWTQHFGSHC
ncbi:MAG TPA: CAP domain-containing protein [Solirubrobacterales bacterium]